MTAYTQSTNVKDTGTAALYNLVGGDTLDVLVGASMVQTANSANGSGTVKSAGSTTITNAGYVMNAGNAFYNNGAMTLSNSGYIEGGFSTSIQRSAGIYNEEGASVVTNSGTVVSHTGHAIISAGSNATATMRLTNSGLIAGYSTVAAVVTTFTSPLAVSNSGVIYGGIGWDVYSNTTNPASLVKYLAPLTVTNSATGLITGGISRILGSEGNVSTSSGGSSTDSVDNAGTIVGDVKLGLGVDMMTNSGTVVGNVDLGVGGDVYTASGAGLVTGSIIGGLGDDLITGGSGKDVIYGDNVSGDTTGGGDTLMGGYGDDVINGGYGADTLYGNQDNDVLYGNQDNDVLYGGQGNDLIYGGQGDDTVVGGAGDDVLYGNLGNDTFVFGAGFGHDTIGDLSQVSANTDLIRFQSGTFADFADVQAHAAQLSTGVLLTDSAGDTLLLVGATTAGLMSSQFVFG